MRIAAWDLGSNSFHLVVAEAAPDGSFVPIAKEKELLGLGAIVEAANGSIPQAAIDSAMQVIRRFKRVADAAGATEHVACATAALRRADNADELLHALREETGIRVQVISGLQEADHIYTAIRAGILIDPGPAVAFDLGGGSLEIMVGDSAQCYHKESLPIGVALVATRHLRSARRSREEIKEIRDLYRTALRPAAERAAVHSPKLAIASAGTFAALARLTHTEAGRAVPRSLNHVIITREMFDPVHEQLTTLHREERKALQGLDPKRVDTIVAGSICLEAIFDCFEFDRITLSDWGLREGLLIDAIRRHDPTDWSSDPRSIRRASVQSLANRCNWPESHSQHVANLSLELFDATVSIHSMSGNDRELLEYAALLHDIGEHVSSEGHERHGAYLIQNGRLRGFDPSEIRVLAGVTRWHKRGSAQMNDPEVGELRPAERKRVQHLCAILRIADGLDRSRSQVVSSILMREGSKSLNFVLRTNADAELEVWGASRKRHLAESLWKRSIRFEVLP